MKIKIIIPLIVFFLIGVFIKNTVSAVTDPNINFRYNITNNEFLQNDINFPSYCYNLPFITTENLDDYAISLYYKHNVNNVYLFYHYIFRNDTVIEKKYDENNIYILIYGYRKMYYPSDVSKNSFGQYINNGSSYNNNFSKWKMFFVFDKNTRQLRFWEKKDGYTGSVLSSLDENILNYPNIKYTQNYNLLRADFNFNYDSFNQWISPLDFENPRTLYGRQLIDKENFIQWIKSNNKQSSFVDYGISTSSNYVENLINLYEANDPFQFFTQIPSFLIDNQSIFSSVEVARGLFNLIDNLYQEYKLSQTSQIKQVDTNSNLLPHHRIDSSTDIYIENATDTIDIKILRDILKTLIQTPYTLYTLFDYYLYNISNNTQLAVEYLTQIPTYMTELLYYRFAPLFSYSGGGFDTSELQDFLLYLFNPTYDSFDEIDIILKDKFDLTELEQFLLLEDNLNQNLLNENDTELIQLGNVGEGGEGGTQTIYPSFKFTLPVSHLTKVPLELKLIDFDKFSIAITAFKGIFSVVIIFFFIRWLIRFFPKVLSGY